MIAGVAGLVYIILQIPIFWLAFQASPASEEVESLTQAYMEIRIWGAPATIGAYVITGWLVAAERTKEILILQLWINGLNMALDVWFVLGLGWGVEGCCDCNADRRMVRLGAGSLDVSRRLSRHCMARQQADL